MPLEPEDISHLTIAAEGYLELNMYLDADEELEQHEFPLSENFRDVPVVRIDLVF